LNCQSRLLGTVQQLGEAIRIAVRVWKLGSIPKGSVADHQRNALRKAIEPTKEK
jgi:hypothetical protein